MASRQTYILGTEEVELKRLEHQHQVWHQEAEELWQRAGFQSGQRLLDLGCGPGFATLDLARLVGANGSVHAVDGSNTYLDYLAKRLQLQNLRQVEIWCGDVYKLKLPPATLDGVYCRFLMLFLKDHKKILRILADGLKSGGRIAITDYFAYLPEFKLIPENRHFTKLITAIDRYFNKLGGNLTIQQQLPKILNASGFDVIDLKPIVRLARPSDPLWQWPEKLFANFFPKLIAAKQLKKTDEHNFWQMWRSYNDDPTAFLVTPTILDIVAQKR